MSLLSFNDETVMLSGRFRDPERRLLFARALLFENRIEFSGLTLSGRYFRQLLLECVEHVEWRSGQAKRPNLIIRLRGGETLRVWMNAAGLWKYEIEKYVRSLSHLLPERASKSG